MRIQDLVNSVARPRRPRGEPVPAGETQYSVSSFITPQSLVSFPVATGVVVIVWQLAKLLLPFGSSSWVPVITSLAIGVLIFGASVSDERAKISTRDVVIGVPIAVLNSLMLAAAALGIPTAGQNIK